MSSPIDPIRKGGPVRRSRRPDGTQARRADDGADRNLPAIYEPPVPPAADSGPVDPTAAFAAHLMGQDGQKRGLRGGAPVLNQARSAYLGAEYSGAANRRPRPGVVARTEI
jgi:hypothetical protein